MLKNVSILLIASFLKIILSKNIGENNNLNALSEHMGESSYKKMNLSPHWI